MAHKFNMAIVAGAVSALMVLTSCEGVVEDVKASPTAQLAGLVLDQPCVLTPREGRRLAGAYLRQPTAAPDSYDPIFITGRETRDGLPRSISFDDSAVRRLRPDAETGGLGGSRQSEAVPRTGFNPTDSLPNVYDLTYRSDRITYQGAMVLGNSMAAFEVPTAGTKHFNGRIDVTLTTPTTDGERQTRTATGNFTVAVGFGSKRAQFIAQDLGDALPFDTLSWSNLYLCGTRLVSSGEGVVNVAAPDAVPAIPFQGVRAAVPLRSIFESTIFAPEDRPAGPASVGGVFVVQSDVGAITGVFLSTPPPSPDAAADPS